MKTKSWKIWLEGRRAVEMLEEQRRNNYDPTPIDLIECPLSTDVVFKVGTSSQTHPGNVAFQEQLLDWYERYFTSSKAEKEIIMSAIINHVQELNGRFLEWDERGCWRVIHDISVIRLKVYHSMFYMQRSANAAKSQQSSASSTYIFERQDGRKRKRDPDGMETSACGNVCRHWL
jgi:tRNA splicing endonuclease